MGPIEIQIKKKNKTSGWQEKMSDLKEVKERG